MPARDHSLRHHLLAASFLMALGSAMAQPSSTPGSGQAQPGSPQPGSPSAQGSQPGSTGSPGTAGTGSTSPRPGMAQPGAPSGSTTTPPGMGGTSGQPGSPGMAQPGTTPGTTSPGMGTPSTQGSVTTPGTTTGTAMTGPASSRFVSELQSSQYLGSRLDGADVYNSANEKIADVEDIIVSDQGQVVAVVLSYGGVAGIGQTYVAVAPSQLRMRKVSDSETRVETSITTDQLREAPKFSYSARNR